MKLSVDDMTGPDPEKAAFCMRAIITLDGKKVERCVTADEEGGYVVAYIAQEDPRFKAEMIKQGGDCWPVETLRGVVRIVDPDAKL
ncbi:hypothetical protein [Pseudomonas phage PA02_HSun-2022]|nr:hypothetical protein [Pseudomonas phage PA02_HSun-2022]